MRLFIMVILLIGVQYVEGDCLNLLKTISSTVNDLIKENIEMGDKKKACQSTLIAIQSSGGNYCGGLSTTQSGSSTNQSSTTDLGTGPTTDLHSTTDQGTGPTTDLHSTTDQGTGPTTDLHSTTDQGTGPTTDLHSSTDQGTGPTTDLFSTTDQGSGTTTDLTQLLTTSIPQGPTYSLYYCDFENDSCFTQDKGNFVQWRKGRGQANKKTGPIADHTFGATNGHYLFINASEVAEGNFLDSFENTGTFESTTFNTSDTYCVGFYYSMYGKDVQTLRVFTKEASSKSYLAVFTKNGNQTTNPEWLYGQFEVTNVKNPFSLVFEGSTKASAHLSFVSMKVTITNHLANIAIDDLYVYDTSCKNIITFTNECHMTQNKNWKFCYIFHEKNSTWYEAARDCRAAGPYSHLVSVSEDFEQTFIEEAIKNSSKLSQVGVDGWYTSGSKETVSQTFQWTEYELPQDLGPYTNWAVNEPANITGYDCLLMDGTMNYAWAAVPCNDTRPYLCEVNKRIGSP